MKSDWQTAIELVKQGTAMLHDAARYLGTVDDAIQLEECAEDLSLALAAVSDLAGFQGEHIQKEQAHVLDSHR